jgi:hypothetical protein
VRAELPLEQILQFIGAQLTRADLTTGWKSLAHLPALAQPPLDVGDSDDDTTPHAGNF